jgi:hypothetical protein
MMFRRTLVMTFAFAVVTLAAGAPATAKGPSSATVSGPGIGTTSIVWNRPDQHSLGTLTETTFLWDASGMTDARQAADWVPQPPPGELGPKYTVVYHFGRDDAVRQDVYPFADPDPVVYTAPGQHMYDTSIQSGWRITSASLTAVLEGLGADPQVAARQAAITPAAQASAAPTDDSGPVWPWIAAGATGVFVLFGVGTLWRTRLHPAGRGAD